jgi:SAM-dependent methyltransferase
MSRWLGFIETAKEGRKRPPIRYDFDLTKLPERLVSSFAPSHLDEETQQWLEGASKFRLMSSNTARILRKVISRTDANGLTFRGGMHIFSTAQASTLLGREPGNKWDDLLDVGAGDGGVTQRLSPFFKNVYATEFSGVMRWRLWWRGYKVVDTDISSARKDLDAGKSPKLYDLVSCLNVLDRCDKPLSLLQDLKAMLKPDGRILLAVVLPWCPFVESGTKQLPPTEKLPMEGGMCHNHARFETAAQLLIERVIEPSGFSVEKWTRLPYLCEGSPTNEYYVLDDVVMVLKPTTPPGVSVFTMPNVAPME